MATVKDKPAKKAARPFANEAEEAKWWYKNRAVHGAQLLAAVRSGDARILTRADLLARIAASKMPRPFPPLC